VQRESEIWVFPNLPAEAIASPRTQVMDLNDVFVDFAAEKPNMPAKAAVSAAF
jgi:hypothetical protein